ncbi:uncharacterized protein HD556DRAFT_945120 [Suillus plorans]|uniref:Uncharacterized protein n=1 Tax=Suillus plorans TaxID=116603 RepID=A0A9P7AEK5_9AGAM|nr:uncharacterized protein HD556DRAFT_945120 [Suillus plorans]KAG1787696.1 hypothetical protein HD556DRAFT_945120 [Suillus plorans]
MRACLAVLLSAAATLVLSRPVPYWAISASESASDWWECIRAASTQSFHGAAVDAPKCIAEARAMMDDVIDISRYDRLQEPILHGQNPFRTPSTYSRVGTSSILGTLPASESVTISEWPPPSKPTNVSIPSPPSESITKTISLPPSITVTIVLSPSITATFAATFELPPGACLPEVFWEHLSLPKD